MSEWPSNGDPIFHREKDKSFKKSPEINHTEGQPTGSNSKKDILCFSQGKMQTENYTPQTTLINTHGKLYSENYRQQTTHCKLHNANYTLQTINKHTKFPSFSDWLSPQEMPA